jgi:nucleoside-diphosphate-sugar epimerase
MKRSIVTGAAGFIGFALTERLLSLGYEVQAIDNFSRGEEDERYLSLKKNKNFIERRVDLANPMNLTEVDWEVETIFHFAALNGTENFYTTPYEVLRNTTLPLFNISEQILAMAGTKPKIILASTSEVYASTISQFGWLVPTTEEVPLSIEDIRNPRWSYAASKIANEALMTALKSEYGIETGIIRFHNVYGPRMGDKHFLPDFIRRLKNNVYSLYGADQTRSFLFISDAIDAILKVEKFMLNTDTEYIFNVGSDVELIIRDVAKEVLRLCSITAELEMISAPEGSVARRAPDISLITDRTGWAPITTLEWGLAQTIEYYWNN